MQRMTDEKMLAQRERVRALDAQRLVLLHGTELNIGPDGSVDWDVRTFLWPGSISASPRCTRTSSSPGPR